VPDFPFRFTIQFIEIRCSFSVQTIDELVKLDGMLLTISDEVVVIGKYGPRFQVPPTFLRDRD